MNNSRMETGIPDIFSNSDTVTAKGLDEAPLVRWNKSQVVKEGLRLGVPYELTWSCYEGGDKPCGKCGTCIDRAKAFADNSVADPAL